MGVKLAAARPVGGLIRVVFLATESQGILPNPAWLKVGGVEEPGALPVRQLWFWARGAGKHAGQEYGVRTLTGWELKLRVCPHLVPLARRGPASVLEKATAAGARLSPRSTVYGLWSLLHALLWRIGRLTLPANSGLRAAQHFTSICQCAPRATLDGPVVRSLLGSQEAVARSGS